MSVENYFLSREGRVLSTKIIKFLRSLIIKINTEANEEETKESYNNWLKYKYAYEGSDDIYSYEYTMQDCIEANIAPQSVHNKNLLDQDTCFKLCLYGDKVANSLLTYLRENRIKNYKEMNSYYLQFTGIPRKGQEIKIVNKDKVNPSDPDYIYLHQLNIINNPNTYEYVFTNGLIDKIQSEHPDYYYLRYLIDPKKIYIVRNTEQFDIIDYNSSLLTTVELTNFFKIYDRKKIYFNELMYIKGYESRMDMYPFLLEVLLLQDVFMSFFNSYMDNYALANYSDQEIYDILDSYNLSSLKKIKITTLRKIIRDIPDFMELRGSDLVIEKILDVVADDSVTIKRYYLTKTYPIDNNGETKFDTTKTYDENVDIKFKEKIIRSNSSTVTSADSLDDYTEFTEDDDTWGGNLEGLSTSEKANIKAKFKRELMKLDFSSILTKYLTISSTVNSYTKQVKLQNYVGLLWQWLRKNSDSNFMINDELSFNSFTIRPIDLYAAICWFHRYLNGMEDHDHIDKNNFNVANILCLQDTGVDRIVNDISDTVIKLPQGLGDKTIGEILGAHDISGNNTNIDDQMWPYYRLSSDDQDVKHINYKNVILRFDPKLTLSETYAQYEKNAPILAALKSKWMKSATLDEAKAWEYIIEQNQTNTYYAIEFENHSSFSAFIREKSPEFNSYLNTTINSNNFENVYAVYSRLLETFRDYIITATDNIITLTTPNSKDTDSSIDYLEDLKILFKSFMSIYTELHKIEYSQAIDDSPYNRIKLLYYYTKDIIYNKFTSKSYLKDKMKNEFTYDNKSFQMIKDEKLESINDQISKMNTYKDNMNLNVLISKLERNNIISFVEDMIDMLEKRKNKILILSKSDSEFLQIYNEIFNLLSDNNDHFYHEIADIIVGSHSGKEVLILYNEKEIDDLKSEIEEIKNRPDILPHFKSYLESYLFEYYSDKIELMYKLYRSSSVSSFNDKIYLLDKYFTTYFDDINENLKLKFFYKEGMLSYTTFLKDYLIKSRKEYLSFEYEDMYKLKVRYNIKTINDSTVFVKKDKLSLYDKCIENKIN